MNNSDLTYQNTAAKAVVHSKTKVKDLAKQFFIDRGTNKEALTLEESYTKRHCYQHQREQKNLEEIFKYAYEQCHKETARDPDLDWLSQFIDIAQKVHTPSMQKLWARVLKKEIIHPGTTSLKALHILQMMTHRETQLFQKVLSLSCTLGKERSRKLLTAIKYKKRFSLRQCHQELIDYSHYHLPYSSLIILCDLGLLLTKELETNTLHPNDKIHLNYHQITYDLIPIKKSLSFTYYRLSPIGQELAQFIGTNINNNYNDDLVTYLLKYFIIAEKNNM